MLHPERSGEAPLHGRARRWGPAPHHTGGTRRAVGWMSAACLLMLAAPGHAAAAEPSGTAGLDQVLQLFAARRHGHVAFSEVHQLAMLERPLQSSGELLYDAPDHLEKRTLRPEG